eukprot:1057664-Rhodomonas_salina.4
MAAGSRTGRSFRKRALPLVCTAKSNTNPGVPSTICTRDAFFWPLISRSVLWPCAVRGTEIAYGAMRMACDVRY